MVLLVPIVANSFLLAVVYFLLPTTVWDPIQTLQIRSNRTKGITSIDIKNSLCAGLFNVSIFVVKQWSYGAKNDLKRLCARACGFCCCARAPNQNKGDSEPNKTQNNQSDMQKLTQCSTLLYRPYVKWTEFESN